MANEQIPLMRIALLEPFFQRLNGQQLLMNRILLKFGIYEEDIKKPEMLLPATTIYRFTNEAADQLQDPYLGAHVGAQIARTNWGSVNFLNSDAKTLGEFLNEFMAASENYGKSADYQLEMNGTIALLRMQRIFKTSVNPAQADATGIGLFVEVLRKFSGESWDTDQVIAIVCDSNAIPVECLSKTSVINGGRNGFSIRFPASWLYKSLSSDTVIFEAQQNKPTKDRPIDHSLIGVIMNYCEQNLAIVNLVLVANYCGMHPKKLQRELKLQNTSFSIILDGQRRDYAQRTVGASNINFAEIAHDVGFTQLSNFSRAFKRWTDQTPMQYREQMMTRANSKITN